MGSIALASPTGLLFCLLAGMPLAVLALAVTRARRVARALGLAPADARDVLPAALAAAAACVLLGLAAAQPTLQTAEERRTRTESEVMFVVDVSRSMAASSSPTGSTRIARARAAVARLRAATPEVPAGLASLTDRVLPYLFATPDAGVFAETLRRSVALESPPPQDTAVVATSLAALSAIGRDGFFSPKTKHRTCVVVTDGESIPFSVGGTAAALRGPRGCRLVLIHVQGGNERVFRPDGTPEANYRPVPEARANVDRLAAAAGGSAFGEDELDAAATAIETSALAGAEGRASALAGERPLAPWLAAGALVLALLLAWRRLRPFGGAAENRRYHAVSES